MEAPPHHLDYASPADLWSTSRQAGSKNRRGLSCRHPHPEGMTPAEKQLPHHSQQSGRYDNLRKLYRPAFPKRPPHSCQIPSHRLSSPGQLFPGGKSRKVGGICRFPPTSIRKLEPEPSRSATTLVYNCESSAPSTSAGGRARFSPGCRFSRLGSRLRTTA